MRKATNILLINLKKEFLFQLRGDKPEIAYPGYWGNFGGSMEEREFPLSELRRELKEELPDCNFENITYLRSIGHLSVLVFFSKEELKMMKIISIKN